MKKQFVIVIITLILLTVGLSGCIENGADGFGKSNEEKILGAWGGLVAGDVETSIFNFFSNGTFSVSAMVFDFWSDSNIRQMIWGTYVMTDNTLATEVKGDTSAFKYSFSDDGKKLTLIAIEQSGQFAVLTKYSSPPAIPSIRFLKDDDTFMLTVFSVNPLDILWSNIEITGTCDTSGLGTYVAAGDKITNCLDTITIRDMPTNFLLGSWTFSVISESASVVVRAENSKIKITLTTAGPNYPSTGYSYTDSVKIRCNGTLLTETGISTGNTGWEVGESLYIGGATPTLDDNASDLIALAPADYSISVTVMNTVIFDNLMKIV